MTTARARLLYGAVGLALGVMALAIVVVSDHEQNPTLTAVLGLLLGWSFVGAGLIAWARRPANGTGRLMTAVGLAWFFGALSDTNASVPYAIGLVVGNVFLAVFIHLLVAYPRGELRGRFERATVVAAYVAALGSRLTLVLVSPHPEQGCTRCPENVLLAIDGHTLRTVQLVFWDTVGAALAAAVVLIIVRRWNAATKAGRRQYLPVAVAGVATMILLGVAFALEPVYRGASNAIEPATLVTFLAVPYLFLAGLLRTRLARAAATQLLLDTPDDPTIEQAESGLRRALRDPTLRLYVWLDRAGGYADGDGTLVEPPPDGPRQVTTHLEYEGRPLAFLVHDRSLRDEPEVLDNVLAATRLALEKDRGLRELRATERRQRALLDAIPDYMFRLRRDGTYLDFHAHVTNDVLGSGRLPGSSIRDYMPPHVAEPMLERIGHVIETGETATLVSSLEHEGETSSFEARIVRSGDDEVISIVRDITEQQRQEDELRRLYRELEARVEQIARERDFTRTVVNIAPSFFLVVDSEARIVRFNRTLERTTGILDGEAVRGRFFWDVFALPEEREQIRGVLGALATGEGDTGWTSGLLAADGDRRVVSWWSGHVVDDEGPRILLCGLDITEQRRQAEEIRRERDFLGTIAQATPSILAIVEASGRIGERGVNQAFAQVTGWSDADAIGKDLADLVAAPEDREAFRRSFAEGAGGWREHGWMTRDGRRVEVAWTLTPLTSYRSDWYLLCAIDVTERNRQERRTQALLDAQPDLMFRMKRDGVYVDYHVHESTQLRTPEVLGLSVYDRLPRDVAERTVAAAARALDEGGVQEYEYALDLRGEARWFDARVVASGEDEVVSIVRDITERKRREAEISSLAAEQAALERVAVAVASEQRPELIFNLVTEEAGRLLGADRANMVRYEPDFAEVVVVGKWQGSGVPVLDLGSRTKLLNGPVSRVAATGLPARIDVDETTPPDLAALLRDEDVSSVVAAPITVSGRLWGALTLSVNSPAQFAAGAEQRVGNFAELVALALANAEAREQLSASRARIVAAGDAERRRLERNLHDGAQQRLVSLSIALRLAQAKLPTDAAAAGAILDGASQELAQALEELRELARGIHPAILTDRGLGPALEALADRAPLVVDLEQLPEERLPAPVEAAAFYVVSEALANVAKYANADRVSVRVGRDNGFAYVEVEDDGVGGADPARGSGLRGLADRVEALDGRIALESPAGAGTRIRAEIPCA